MELHAKRVESLADVALSVMTSGSLAVSLIGKGLVAAKDRISKPAVKQIDRVLSNPGVDPWSLAGRMVPEIVGERTEIVVLMDWTDFDATAMPRWSCARTFPGTDGPNRSCGSRGAS